MNSYIKDIINKEKTRLNNEIELIASENYPSQAILDILGSCLSVKYAEGYPKEVSTLGRYYAGCENIDLIELYAIEKAKELFKCNFVNVQPHSGSQANMAAIMAFCKPGDTILGMNLNAGGHLTHGAKVSFSGKLYNAISYGVDDNGYIDYDDIKNKLYKENPRLLIVGASAYSRIIDFEKIRNIVDEYNQTIFNSILNDSIKDESVLFPDSTLFEKQKCYLMVDMAHIAGLVAAGLHPSPIPYADVVTSTTHKTLRGPRSGLILWNNENYTKKINSSVFPGIQGGPNGAMIAAKAQCFIEANSLSFIEYIKSVCKNMQALLKGIKEEDPQNKLHIISGGSDNHLALLNVKEAGLSGKDAENLLLNYGIVTNKNSIPGDISAKDCSGIRIGTAAITTKGFNEEQCENLGKIISKILLNTNKEQSFVEDIKQSIFNILKEINTYYK